MALTFTERETRTGTGLTQLKMFSWADKEKNPVYFNRNNNVKLDVDLRLMVGM